MSKWKLQYQNQQIPIPKSANTNTKLQVSQLVMLKDNETMPLKWDLARIIEVHPGSDSIVRMITVRSNKGVYKRLSIFIR